MPRVKVHYRPLAATGRSFEGASLVTRRPSFAAEVASGASRCGNTTTSRCVCLVSVRWILFFVGVLEWEVEVFLI